MGQMKGRVVLMTGAAGAIGKPMCVELARRGATVVMAGLYLDATVRTRLWTESARLVGLR